LFSRRRRRDGELDVVHLHAIGVLLLFEGVITKTGTQYKLLEEKMSNIRGVQILGRVWVQSIPKSNVRTKMHVTQY
jgi:hypothetical protein